MFKLKRAGLRKPAYLDRVFDRGSRYLYHIVESLETSGLPLEIALLPLVESAFDPFAYSHGRASGLWQFIPGTARLQGLTIDWCSMVGAMSFTQPRRRSNANHAQRPIQGRLGTHISRLQRGLATSENRSGDRETKVAQPTSGRLIYRERPKPMFLNCSLLLHW